MLPVREWYWDPKRALKSTKQEQSIQTMEDDMGWDKVFAVVAVIVAEEAIRQLISKIEE